MTALLDVSDLHAAYGAAEVLFGMGFTVARGEVVTLMGRNGMGKTTTIHTMMGMMKASAGRVVFDGQDLSGQPAYRIAQAGLGLVPVTPPEAPKAPRRSPDPRHPRRRHRTR